MQITDLIVPLVAVQLLQKGLQAKVQTFAVKYSLRNENIKLQREKNDISKHFPHRFTHFVSLIYYQSNDTSFCMRHTAPRELQDTMGFQTHIPHTYTHLQGFMSNFLKGERDRGKSVLVRGTRYTLSSLFF